MDSVVGAENRGVKSVSWCDSCQLYGFSNLNRGRL